MTFPGANISLGEDSLALEEEYYLVGQLVGVFVTGVENQIGMERRFVRVVDSGESFDFPARAFL